MMMRMDIRATQRLEQDCTPFLRVSNSGAVVETTMHEKSGRACLDATQLGTSMSCCCAELMQKKGAAKLRRELLVGFDPVILLHGELQQRYQGAASFFVDVVGGHTIGIKWSSKLLEGTPFDARKAHLLEPPGSQGLVNGVQACAFSVSAVLADIQVLGAGLIKRVEFLKQ